MMFFDDRDKAVLEIEHVMRPGGRVAIAIWASLSETPGHAAVVDLLDRLLGKEAGNALRAPYDMGDAGELERLLSDVFTDVAVTRHEGTARFDSIEPWVHTDIRGWTLSDISDEDYGRLLAAAGDDLAKFTDDTGRCSQRPPSSRRHQRGIDAWVGVGSLRDTGPPTSPPRTTKGRSSECSG